MTLDMGNTDKLMLFRREAQRLNVKVIPPSVNASGVDFAVVKGAVLYSLAGAEECRRRRHRAHCESARGGVGRSARSGNSPSASMRAWSTSGRWKAWPRRVRSTASIPTGRRCSTPSNPSSPCRTVAFGSAAEAGQNDLFGGMQSSVDELVLPRRDAWLPMDKLAQEFEAVGFYLRATRSTTT